MAKRAVLKFQEDLQHLLSIPVSVTGIDLDRSPHEIDKVGVNASSQFGIPRRWPLERPLGPLAGQQSPDNQPDREHIGPKRRLAHGLLGSHIANCSCAAALNGFLRHFGNPEVRKANPVSGEDDYVFRFDIAMNYVVRMS